MTKILSLIQGIYPRSEVLRRSVSRWERKAITDDELSERIRDEKTAILEQFRTNGIWGYTDPLSNWNDVLRGIVKVLTQVNPGKLTRYKETNTFYKQPDIVGYPEFSENVESPGHDTHLPGELFVGSELPYFHFLPGIDSFLNMSVVDPDLDGGKLRDSLLSAYRQLIHDYSIRKLVLFEPYPSEHASSVYDEIFSSVKTYYVIDDFPPEYFQETKSEPSSIMVRNSERFSDLSTITALPGLEVFDSQNTKVENPSEVRSKILSLGESSGVEQVIATHTEYLDFLPRVIADKKTAAIGIAGDAI